MPEHSKTVPGKGAVPLIEKVERPRPWPNPPASKVPEPKEFRIKNGMRINIEGGLYKVIAIRPSGKLTLKYIRQVA